MDDGLATMAFGDTRLTSGGSTAAIDGSTLATTETRSASVGSARS